MRMRYILFSIVLLFSTVRLRAAVGCDLNDPDRDVKRLFPGSTGYKTEYVSIAKKGGEQLLKQVEARLGDSFKGLYENIDVPYTMYRIYKNQELIGFIHGVNQKGRYGGIQVFLALDTKGNILAFYIQKLTSRDAAKFRDRQFGQQFVGLTLRDFYRYDPATGKESPSGKISRITNPAPESADDFKMILRAVKKNLILMDEFLLGNQYLPYFNSSRSTNHD